MKKKETKPYPPLKLEVVEVIMEHGYAKSGGALDDIENGGSIWD